MEKEKWSKAEEQFLLDSWAKMSSSQLYEIWYKKFGVYRSLEGIRSKAKKICKGAKLRRKKTWLFQK